MIFYKSKNCLAVFRQGNSSSAVDVFQLGLVLAEMFTGENPLISGDIKSPVLLKRIGEITDAGKHGGLVFNSIREMLNKDYSKRPHPNKTLDHFLQIYEDITKQKK